MGRAIVGGLLAAFLLGACSTPSSSPASQAASLVRAPTASQLNLTGPREAVTDSVPVNRPADDPASRFFGRRVDGAQALTAGTLLTDPFAVDDVLRAMTERDAQQSRRNTYIAGALAASEERCSAYLQAMTEIDRETNTALGALSVLSAGLGAVFTPAATVRALSGGAAIAGGWRETINSATFYNQTIQAITKAIQTAREADRAIIHAMYAQPYAEVTYSMAFEAVQRYHSHCSLNGAFARIDTALERSRAEVPNDVQAYFNGLAGATEAFGRYRGALRNAGQGGGGQGGDQGGGGNRPRQ